MSVKRLMKAAARAAAYLATAPLVPSFTCRAAMFGRDRALEASIQWLSLIPGLSGQYIRRAFLSRALNGCHETAVVECGTTLSRAGSRLDENAYVGPGCRLGLVHIERDVLIAAGVHIPSGPSTHLIDDLSRPIREQGRAERLVRIGAGAWIGEAAVIMADVGANAIVGAGAVVTRPVPPRAIVAGVPARVIRLRGSETARAV
ncbi:MAG TPA: acyltransferase [Vicinamibacterales bacterium]|nr:acyltransferase [Vicinamibacterales bacterium]